ncbi:hypothetical protein BCR32DRAFT_192423, partial [Anaeromyces robustus]
ACQSGNITIIKYLIEHGANVNKETNDFTPLIAACQNGNNTIIKYLIEHGANVNKKIEVQYNNSK